MCFTIEKSKDNLEVFKINKKDKNVYLGSKYNQQRVIDKFIRNIGEFKSNDIYIIIGLADGEHIREVIRKCTTKRSILVIEYNEEIIKYTSTKNKKIFDGKIVISSSDIVIKKIIAGIDSNIIENIKIIIYGNYDVVYRDEIRKTLEVIKDSVNDVVIDRNTYKMFGEKWFYTFISNIKNSNFSNSLELYKNIHKNKPAIIVSAGPSLEKNIDELKKNSGAIIFSGGRTLRSLEEKNIDADYLCVIDSGKVSYELVEKRISTTKVPLVYTGITNAEIVKEHNANKIIFGKEKVLSEIWGNSIPDIRGGGSVAHTMTEVAIYMGCNPIIFIGQDLAYTNDMGHSRIAYNENDNKNRNVSDIELFEDYKSNSDIYIDSINGGKVRTSLVLNSFKQTFERIIECNKEITFINSTEGGAIIEGTKNISLRESIRIHCTNSKGNGKKVEDYDTTENREVIIKKSFENIVSEVEYCMKLVGNAKMKLNILKEKYIKKKSIKNIISELDSIELEIRKKMLQFDFINDLAYEKIYSIENNINYTIKDLDSENERFKKIYEKNQALYKIILELLNVTKNEVIEVFGEVSKN